MTANMVAKKNSATGDYGYKKPEIVKSLNVKTLTY